RSAHARQTNPPRLAAAPRAPGKGALCFSARRYPQATFVVKAFPALPDDVAILRVQLHQQRLAAGTRGRDERAPAAAEHVQHRIASLTGVPQRPLDQRDRLHRRVLLAALGPIHVPDGGLTSYPGTATRARTPPRSEGSPRALSGSDSGHRSWHAPRTSRSSPDTRDCSQPRSWA